MASINQVLNNIRISFKNNVFVIWYSDIKYMLWINPRFLHKDWPVD